MKNKSYFFSVTHRETGARHIRKGKGCEDNVYTVFSEKTGVKTVALSDGAGSCKNAAIGSAITSEVAAKLLAEKFNMIYSLDSETAAEYITKGIVAPLEQEARKSGNELFSYSATVLCVAMHPDGRYIAFHIGDGAIVGYNSDNGCRVVSVYEHDGPVNLTNFVTDDDIQYKLFRGKNEYSAFLLMSDGPEDFLVRADKVNDRAKILIQLSYFVSEEVMKDRMSGLIDFFNENGMSDDASFAVIVDNRSAADVFKAMPNKMRSSLYEINEKISPKKMKRIVEIIGIITSYPDGADLQQIRKQLHVHSPLIAKKKLQGLIDMEIIEKNNGRYYMTR